MVGKFRTRHSEFFEEREPFDYYEWYAAGRHSEWSYGATYEANMNLKSGIEGAEKPGFTEILDIGNVKVYGGPCSDIPDSIDVPVVSLNGSWRGQVRAEIDDFSIQPVRDLAASVLAAIRIADQKGAIGFCCRGGCGRTSTALLLFALAKGVPLEDALSRFVEKRGCGSESRDQRFLLAVMDLLRERLGVKAVSEAIESLYKTGFFDYRVPASKSSEKNVIVEFDRTGFERRYLIRGTDVEVDSEVAGMLHDMLEEIIHKGLDALTEEDAKTIAREIGDNRHPLVLLAVLAASDRRIPQILNDKINMIEEIVYKTRGREAKARGKKLKPKKL